MHLDNPVQAVCMVISPLSLGGEQAVMREHMIGYILACGIAHRLNELFSLFDTPQVSSHMTSHISCLSTWLSQACMISYGSASPLLYLQRCSELCLACRTYPPSVHDHVDKTHMQ